MWVMDRVQNLTDVLEIKKQITITILKRTNRLMRRLPTQRLISSINYYFSTIKHRFLPLFAVFLLTLLNVYSLHGQAADAINAVQVCEGLWPEPAFAPSTGSVNDLPTNTAKGCLTGEHGSNWYYMRVNTSGTMAFSVQGIMATGAVADIDGSVFGPFTSVAAGAAAITAGSTPPIRCTYASGTGMELRVGVSQTSDNAGTGVISAINATAGQYYLIFIDNFDAGNSNRAVSMSWTFTVGNSATYSCPTMPTSCGPSCSAATCPVSDLGILPAKGVQPSGTFTFTQCNNYSNVPFKSGDGTFMQCYTVNSDAYGNLGVMQSIVLRGSDDNNDGVVDSLLTVSNSRVATLTLAASPCGIQIPPSRTKAGNDATFNPEWDNLQPNTSYILCIATTMPLFAVTKAFNYRQSCVDVYHYVPPTPTLYAACIAPPKWWYKANAGVNATTTGAPVNFWSDQSPNGYNVAQSGAARPTYNTSGINFNPTINFDGTQNLFRASTVGLTGTDKTVLSVALANNLPAGTAGLIGSGGTFNEVQYGYQGGRLNIYENIGNNALATSANIAGTVMLSTAIENNNTTTFYNNGLINGTATANSNPPTNRLTIGSHTVNNNDKNYFNGQIAEILVFDRVLTAAERANAESYLAIKYGVTLGHDYTNSSSTVLYPLSSYMNRVTVVGREDCQNLNQKQSVSVNNGLWSIGLKELKADNASNLNAFSTDNTFLAVGDDNGSMTATILAAGSVCTPPVGTDAEVPRRWKVVQTGTPDSVFMQMPTASITGFDLSRPVYMVIADDAAFTTGLKTIGLSKKGGNYEQKTVFPTGTHYFKLIGTGLTTTYCMGSSYLQWSANPWAAGTLTKTTPLSNGLSATTTVTNPNNILVAGYPKMMGTNPSVAINTTSSNDIVTWSTQFNQVVTGAGFYIYDLDKTFALNETVQIKGYKGATAVAPTLSKSLFSPLSINAATATASGGINNLPTYDADGRVYVSFNGAIDRFVITFKNNTTTFRNMAASISIGDVSIYCPEPVIESDLVSMKKIAPTASVRQGDTISYTFKLTNVDCTPKTIDVVDNLPSGMVWVKESYTPSMSGGALNNYGGSNSFSLTAVTIPAGISTFTLDAVANVSGTRNNQATFLINNRLYSSDDPNQSGTIDPTPLSISSPLTTPPVSITKSVATPSVLASGTQTFTYTVKNVGAMPVTMDFTDELVADSMTYIASTLSGMLGGGTASAYAATGNLTITGMSIPVGTSTFTVQVAMNNVSSNTYENTATLNATGATYTPNVIASNTATWVIAPPASFSYAFDCTGSAVAGTFIADGTPNQGGTVTIPINVINAGFVTINVTGTNFTGTRSTVIAAGQSTLVVPITYSGGGAEGSRILTLMSSAGTGNCSVLAQIQSSCKASGGRIGQ
jgi:uncharacterized repeat protein (TIGR01451 family)